MSDEQRWNLCLSTARDKRYMHTKRSQTVVLSDCGVELASKTTFTTRGKITQTLYTFTAAAPGGLQYRVELMNKVRNGRACGNDFIVVWKGPQSRNSAVVSHHGSDESAARWQAAVLNGMLAGI